jgi:hypothetical protein
MFMNPYTQHSTYSNQADIARFAIPARKGAGDYIVYFNWQGYSGQFGRKPMRLPYVFIYVTSVCSR